MLEFLAENLSEYVVLAIFLVALFPALESKVAIPFALAQPIWGPATLSPLIACGISFLGTMLPSFFIILISRKIKAKTSGFVHDKFLFRIQSRLKKHFNKFNQKTSILNKCMYLGCFVALPLPLTGVYTGSLIAGFSNLKIWQGFVSILIGELLTCIGLTIICTLFENSAFYLLIMSIILGFLLMLGNLVLQIVLRVRQKTNKNNKE